MLRAVIGFAAGFVLAGLVVESGSVKKFKEVAKEKASKIKSATLKAAAAAREEFRGSEGSESEAEKCCGQKKEEAASEA